MCAPVQMHSCDCQPSWCCGGFLTVDEEIKKMEVTRQNLQLHLEMLDKRIDSLKKVGK